MTTNKLDLGPMDVYVGDALLGLTKGGVTVTVKESHAAMTADQSGSTPLDFVVTGHEYQVKMALADVKDLTVWQKAFPRAELIGTTAKKLVFKNAVGQKLSTSAVELKLHPHHLPLSDKSMDYTFPAAVAKSGTEVKYGPEEQIVLEVEFGVLPDTDGQFLIVGDPDAADEVEG